MGLFSIFKKKRTSDDKPLLLGEGELFGEGQGQEGVRTVLGDETFATLLELPAKPQYNQSYLVEKLSILREQAEIYQYESNFVESHYLDESGFLDTMKSKLEELWKMVLVLLFMGKMGNGGGTFGDGGEDKDIEEISYEEVDSLVSEMSPGLKKTILKNMLKKLEGEQNVLGQKDITNEQALLASLKIEGERLTQLLILITDIQKDLCRPDELDLDPTDPASVANKEAYTKLYNQLFVRQKRLEQIVKIYNTYITTVEQLYIQRKKLSEISEEETAQKIREQFVFQHQEDPLLFRIEEKNLEEQIKKACEPIEQERGKLQTMIERLEAKKTKETLQILDIQRVRFYKVTSDNGLSKDRSRSAGDGAGKVKIIKSSKEEYLYCQIQKSPQPEKPDSRTYYKVTVTKQPFGISIVSQDHVEVRQQLDGVSKTKRDEILQLLTQDPAERPISSNTYEMVTEGTGSLAVQQKAMREKWSEDKEIYDKCDKLIESGFAVVEQDMYGDTCTTFLKLGVSIRHDYLRTGEMKQGEYSDGKNDNQFYTDLYLLSTMPKGGRRNCIYKNTIDQQKQTWKDAMDEDCVTKGYVRKTKAHQDLILSGLATELSLTYSPSVCSDQPIIKAYMYLTGALGRERLNTNYKTEEEGGVYGQVDGKSFDSLWILYCSNGYQRFRGSLNDTTKCSIPLIRLAG